MSVAIKCERLYDKAALKAIIECCGCCPPPEPQCPALCCTTCCSPAQCCPPPASSQTDCGPSCKMISCDEISSPGPRRSRGPCSLPTNNSIPASCKAIRPIVTRPIKVGGLFYTGISRS